MVVVLQPLVEAFLLEDHAVVDAGHLAVVLVRAGQDLAVIGLGPAGQAWPAGCGGCSGRRVRTAARRGRGDQRHQLVVGQADFLPGVEVEVVGRGLDPRLRPAGRPVEQVVGGDQVLVDGVAQVRQVDAAERAVPVAAVALAAVEFGAGLLDQLALTGRRPRRSASCSRRLTIIIREYISSASGYFTLKFRQKPPRTNRRSAGQRGSSLHLVREPLVLDQLLGRQRPFGHFAVAAVGQIDLAHGGTLSNASASVVTWIQSWLCRQRVEEPLQPAVVVDVLLRLRPGAELLAVVAEHDHRVRVLARRSWPGSRSSPAASAKGIR